MTPAYASLKPTRSKSWNGLQIHTAGVSATLMSRMVKLKDASAEAGVAFLCEFAELCPRFIGVYDGTPEKMGDCEPLDASDLPVELVQELMLFAAGVEDGVPLS
jgi:hypothetical protein